MSFSPHAVPRRLLTAALAIVAVMALSFVAGSTAVAGDDDDLEDKQDQVQQEKRHAAHDLETSSEELQAAREALAQAKSMLSKAREALAAVEQKLDSAMAKHQQLKTELGQQQKKLDAAEKDLEVATDALRNQRASLRDLLLDEYREGNPELIGFSSMVSGEATLEEIMRRDAYAKDVEAAEENEMDRVDAQQAVFAEREAKVQEITDVVKAKEAKAEKKVDEIERLRKAAAENRDKVSALVDERSAAEKKAQRLRAHDLQVLEDLKKEEARIQQLIEDSSDAGGNETVGDLSNWLLPPLDAPITSPYGMRQHPVTGEYKLHDGTDFGADCGTPSKAVESGKVIDAYYNEAWGNRVLVALGTVNGHTFTAIYNHFESDAVSVGQTVSRGDTVGYVGTTGWSTGCHLHFTLMRDGQTVDPMNYMPVP